MQTNKLLRDLDTLLAHMHTIFKLSLSKSQTTETHACGQTFITALTRIQSFCCLLFQDFLKELLQTTV